MYYYRWRKVCKGENPCKDLPCIRHKAESLGYDRKGVYSLNRQINYVGRNSTLSDVRKLEIIEDLEDYKGQSPWKWWPE